MRLSSRTGAATNLVRSLPSEAKHERSRGASSRFYSYWDDSISCSQMLAEKHLGAEQIRQSEARFEAKSMPVGVAN